MTPTGKATSFFTRLRGGFTNEPKHSIKVVGEEIGFGLVLHRAINGKGEQDDNCGWTISEPATGTRVLWGWHREDAIENLAEKVAAYGGPEKFQSVIDLATDKMLENPDVPLRAADVIAEVERRAAR